MDAVAFHDNKGNPRRSFRRIFALLLLAGMLICLGVFVVVEVQPSIGAALAVQVRSRFGPEVVARLESIVFQVQDTVKQWGYQLGIQQAQAPWQGTSPQESSTAPALEPTEIAQSPSLTPALAIQTPTRPPTAAAPAPSPTPTLTPYVWQLPTLTPFGSLEDEGVWIPYLYDPQGHVVAARAFLQPDPSRPYAIVAVVAFDLTRTQLHYVSGFTDPFPPGGPRGDGLIPEEDRLPGVLLATFNGGFRAENGQYGSMSNGGVVLPPKEDAATIGIYRDGAVRMGRWGEEINDSPDLIAWRQNCSIVLLDGEISPKVYNNSTVDWGGTISNDIVTRRSGVGLDKEANTLYYFAGPNLSMPILAEAMQAAGAWYGMLLDINNFWVLFTSIRSEQGKLVADPLLPKEMTDKVDRYLGPSPADFFYVTARERSQP